MELNPLRNEVDFVPLAFQDAKIVIGNNNAWMIASLQAKETKSTTQRSRFAVFLTLYP